MIVERSSELVALIRQREERRAQVQLLTGLRSRQEQLGAMVVQLAPLAATAEEMARRKIVHIEMRDRVPGLIAQLNVVWEAFTSDRDAFVSGQAGFVKLKPIFEAFLAELKARIETAWREYTARRVPQMSLEVLGVLEAIPAYRPKVQRIRELNTLISQLRPQLPTAAVIDKFEDTILRLNRAWSELDEGALSPAVLTFLRAASTGGASLDQLTPDIQAWLSNHELTSSFRIRVAGGGSW